MPPTTTVPDAESLADLRRRVEELEAHMAALGRPVTGGAHPVKQGWRAQVGAFGGDPVYAEIVRGGREWREAQDPGQERGNGDDTVAAAGGQ